MPPLPAIRSPLLADLCRQLRYAPADALRRDLERAERLAAEIDPSREYPDDWMIFRVTGYRPGDREPAGVVQGRAVLADLSAFVERLSDAARLDEAELRAAGAVGVAELAAKWNVSRKTIDRLRREGLVARRARSVRGRRVLLFLAATIAAFESRHGDRLREAGGFTRIEPDAETRILRRAHAYRRRLGWSLNRAAARLAERFGRSHEAVRQLLRRADIARAESGQPVVFEGRGPLRASSRGELEARWRRGEDPAEIARRLGHPRAAVQRAINLARAERLRGLLDAGVLPPPTGPVPPPGPTPSDSALRAPQATRDLGTPGVTDLSAFLSSARRREAFSPVREAALSAAHQALRRRAAAAISALSRLHPQSGPLDRIETDLRWAARLKAELMRPQLALVVETATTVVGVPPEELRSSACVSLLRALLSALADSVDHHDPHKGGRVAGAAALALSRAAARWLKDQAVAPAPLRPRASTRIPEGIPFDDWTLAVAPWQTWLDADARLRAAAMPPRARGILAARLGWDGRPPRTLDELAAELGVARVTAPALERRAWREAWASVTPLP